MPEIEKNKEELLVEQLKKLNRNLREQNKYYKRSQVVLRSLAAGIFTAIGATIGFGLVIIVLASFVRTISAVPIIDDILKQTKLDQLIEYQLQQIESNPSVSPTPSPTKNY